MPVAKRLRPPRIPQKERDRRSRHPRWDNLRLTKEEVRGAFTQLYGPDFGPLAAKACEVSVKTIHAWLGKERPRAPEWLGRVLIYEIDKAIAKLLEYRAICEGKEQLKDMREREREREEQDTQFREEQLLNRLYEQIESGELRPLDDV